MRSLCSRLLVLWALSLLACVAVGVLLVRLSGESTSAQVGQAEALAARACDLVRDRYAFYATGWRGPVPSLDDAALRRDLATVVTLALAREQGIEGGIWQADAGSLAYAFPTYPGGPKTDLPAAEVGRIRAVNEQAAREETAVAREYAFPTQTLLLHACPLGGPVPALTAWTMTRVRTASSADRLRLGLGVLLALVLGMSGWLAWLLASWSRRVGRLVAALAGHAASVPPALAPTGDPDLDRVVAALNGAGARLEVAQAQLAASERLAAVGRVAAGVAHEIRNPLAAMRLRAENALAMQDPERRERALRAVLEQVARLDRLLSELLAMTQRPEPRPEPIDLAAMLGTLASDHADRAAAGNIALRVEGSGQAMLDPGLLRRALDNLVSNALCHTPPGGTVTLSAGRMDGKLLFAVEDTGPGVAPELQHSLFEPFVTGRPEGTGLGLAIARELVAAQGGTLWLDRAGADGDGARFAVELPAPEPPPAGMLHGGKPEGAAWPPS